MAKGIDLEILRDIFRDDAVHIALAAVTHVAFSPDQTAVYVTCNLVHENREIMATLAWDSVGANSGFGDLPELEDLVLVCFADRETEHAFIFKRLASSAEPLPIQMQAGHMVMKAKPGKKTIIASDTKVEVGKGNPLLPPTQPLVLGTVLTNYLTALEAAVENIISQLNSVPAAISSAPGTLAGINPALVTALTLIKTQMATDKATYLTASTTNIVSQIAFTER